MIPSSSHRDWLRPAQRYRSRTLRHQGLENAARLVQHRPQRQELLGASTTHGRVRRGGEDGLLADRSASSRVGTFQSEGPSSEHLGVEGGCHPWRFSALQMAADLDRPAGEPMGSDRSARSVLSAGGWVFRSVPRTGRAGSLHELGPLGYAARSSACSMARGSPAAVVGHRHCSAVEQGHAVIRGPPTVGQAAPFQPLPVGSAMLAANQLTTRSRCAMSPCLHATDRSGRPSLGTEAVARKEYAQIKYVDVAVTIEVAVRSAWHAQRVMRQ